jgi:hypothetical protein
MTSANTTFERENDFVIVSKERGRDYGKIAVLGRGVGRRKSIGETKVWCANVAS